VRITEFLKPGVDEFTAVLPRWLARPLRSWAERTGIANRLNVGLYVKTTSVSGFLLMRFLAWLRPLRPLTARWHEERALIDRWLAAVAEAARRNLNRAGNRAVWQADQRGETHKRQGNFLRILDTPAEGA
jgi:indolepyruvate ferredoxin oxidoreductase beta subunit